MGKKLTQHSVQGALNTMIDETTNAIVSIDYEHHEAHNSSSYFIKGFAEAGGSDFMDFRCTTPDTLKWIHMVFSVNVESETEIFVYEDAVILNAETELTPINRNRNSSNTSVMACDYAFNTDEEGADADTDLTGATLLGSWKMGSGKGSGGGLTAREEIILKKNTVYCYRIKSVSAGFIDFLGSWYEHTNKSN